MLQFEDSNKYWERRYSKGGASGIGSYGKRASYKARIVNNFVKENDINSIIDMGCGDGNQISKFDFLSDVSYLGVDVSKTVVEKCREKFSENNSMDFILYDKLNERGVEADLVLSLDVIFHLVEDKIYEKYMEDLFDLSEKYVLIRSTDIEDDKIKPHIKHRKFTDWIKTNRSDWHLIQRIDDPFGIKEISFYIFKKSV